MTSEQREELARLQQRRPDLIELTKGEDGPQFEVAPYDLGRIRPEDTEAVEVALQLVRTVAPSSTPLSVAELCRYLLPVVERTAALDPTRASGFAEMLRETEMPSGYIVERTAEQTARRLDAIATGGCGCALDPLPYWEPADAPFLSEVGRRNVSTEGYVTVEVIDVRCERCGAAFEVTKRTDYDRWTYDFARATPPDGSSA